MLALSSSGTGRLILNQQTGVRFPVGSLFYCGRAGAQPTLIRLDAGFESLARNCDDGSRGGSRNQSAGNENRPMGTGGHGTVEPPPSRPADTVHLR